MKCLFFSKPLDHQNETVRTELMQFVKEKGFLEISHDERVLRSNKKCGHIYSSPDDKARFMDVNSPYPLDKCVEDRFRECTNTITQLYQGKNFIDCDSSVKDAFDRLNEFATKQILGAESLGRFKKKLEIDDFFLGFIQFISLEPGKRLGNHTDGSLYGDLVAVFCMQGFSDNSIDGHLFELKQGEMYIFDSSQWHSVDCSRCKERRFAVTLRYYVKPHICEVV